MTPAVQVGDAFVMVYTKYRIRSIDARGLAELADSGPHWRRTPITGKANTRFFEWDTVAGVWRMTEAADVPPGLTGDETRALEGR
jgi:hypothetical protein